MDAPDNPLPVAARWLHEAATRSTRRNPVRMALATSPPSGRPSVRMVLPKRFDEAAGYIVFFTHYESRKAGELESNPRAAGVLYWEEFGGRQLRLEGRVGRSPAEESDAYFATRPVQSQLNAWVSEQSRPIGSADILRERCNAKARELGISAAALEAGLPCDVPRPPHWGGLRIWIDALELWTEGEGRFHERLAYTRSLTQQDDGTFVGTPWQFRRLQP